MQAPTTAYAIAKNEITIARAEKTNSGSRNNVMFSGRKHIAIVKIHPHRMNNVQPLLLRNTTVFFKKFFIFSNFKGSNQTIVPLIKQKVPLI